MAEKSTYLRTSIFIAAIIFGIIIQILIYITPPLKENEFLQMAYISLFYIPIILILITFPRIKSINKQIIAINILVLCLILASMNVDYQVLWIFTDPALTSNLLWNKAYNLYWAAWMFQMSIVFLIFAVIYKLRTNNTWTAFRIGAVGPLISLFSFEDIIYYPMHGETPFGKIWSWLPQHTFYMGHDINTVELIWIVTIAMIAIFVFLVIFVLKKSSNGDEHFNNFSSPKEKKVFLWTLLIGIGAFCGFVILYLNTNIVNNQIPFYLLLFFAGIAVLFILLSSYFPKVKSHFKQLVAIFVCYIIFWVAATEMDWHAVERGFHWLDDLTPPGDFWVWCDYRMAMWLIFLPITLLVISVIFKLVGNSRHATLKLGIMNFLIIMLGIDSILIFFVAGGAFPPQWTWSNLHYSIFNGIFSLPVLIGFAIALGVCMVLVMIKMKEKPLE